MFSLKALHEENCAKNLSHRLRSMKRYRFLIPISLVFGLAACDRTPEDHEVSGQENAQTAQQGGYEVGQRLEPVEENDSGNASDVITLEWDQLVPPEYDPMVLLEGVDLNSLDDDDPKARELLEEVQAAWANAPVVEALNGRWVRIPGFAVPLDGDADTVNEMLLVPYFGACIHVPPPPSNQIIHVPKMSPVSRDAAYDAVWVEGVLRTRGKHTDVGSAGYTLEAGSVRPYE